MVPIPYNIVGEFSEATGVSPNIKSNGEPVVIHASTVISRVYGDEAGIGKGIKSKTVGARVQPMEKSSSLSFNGERAVRVGDLVYMNDKNTIGMVFERMPSPPAAPVKEGEPSATLVALAKLIGDPYATTKVFEFIPSALVNLVPGGPLISSALGTATKAASRLLTDLGVTTQSDKTDPRTDEVRKPPAAAARRSSASDDGGRSRGIARTVPIEPAPPDNSSILRANDRATMPWLYEESQPTRIEMIMSAEALKFGSYYERVSGLSFGIPVDNDGFMFSNTYPVTPGVGVAFTNVFEWDGKSPMVTKYGMFTADRNAEGGYYFREATEEEASVMLGTHRSEAAALSKTAVMSGGAGYGRGIGSLGGSWAAASLSGRATVASPAQMIASSNASGKPAAIARGMGALNSRQKTVLDRLPVYGSKTIAHKSFGQRDLSALTAATGDEFAMFSTGGRRLIYRGDFESVPITPAIGSDLAAQGWKWSSHVHPGFDVGVLHSSLGDRAVLAAMGGGKSAVCNSDGQLRLFTPLGDSLEGWKPW